MTCAEFEDLILDRIDGRLSPGLAASLDSHLAACEYCQGFSAAASEMDRSITQTTQDASLPTRFASDLLRKIDRPKRRLPGFLGDLAGVGSVAAAGAFCFWHLVPNLIAGGEWLAATVIVCGGMCIAVSGTES